MLGWNAGIAYVAYGLVVCASRFAGADTITLLNRKVYEGKIVGETADVISLETQMAGETVRLDFGRHEVLEVSRTTGMPAAQTEAKPTTPERTQGAEDPADQGESLKVEIEGNLETSRASAGWHGVLTATIRCELPRDTAWVVSAGTCEKPDHGTQLLPVRVYWEGEFSNDQGRTGSRIPKASPSQAAGAARRELESKCRRAIRDRVFEKMTAESPIYRVGKDGAIRMLRVVVVTGPGMPESILFGEGGHFQIAGSAQWVESPNVTQADLSRIAFVPRCKENLRRVGELLGKIGVHVDEVRDAAVRAVPVYCNHCDGDGRLTGRDAGMFTVSERAEWDRRVSAAAAMQTGTGFSRITLSVACSECGGSGRVGERQPTQEFRRVAETHLKLLKEWEDVNQSLQLECERQLAALEQGKLGDEAEWERLLADSVRRTETIMRLGPMLERSAEEMRRIPR